LSEQVEDDEKGALRDLPFLLDHRAHLRNVPRRGMTRLDERKSPGEWPGLSRTTSS
jgi:hypothetical protein